MDEGKTELTLQERADLLKSKVSFHNKKAGWKRTYREKFNALVKQHSAKVESLKAKRNKSNEEAKELKERRDEATDYYRKAKLNNNINVMNAALKEQDKLHKKMMEATEEGNRYHGLMKDESEEVLRLVKKADKCHNKMLKAKSKADSYYKEYIEVTNLIIRGEEE
jgi:uncharacterized coiled-coil DUF342 family protein